MKFSKSPTSRGFHINRFLAVCRRTLGTKIVSGAVVFVATFWLTLEGVSQTQPDQILIKDVFLIACTHTEPPQETSVLIKSGLITSIGSIEETDVDGQTHVIDGRGKYLIPGLWDMHVHLSKAGESSLKLFVANGVTSVRDMGGDYQAVLEWKREVQSGERVGPQIWTAGPILESQSNIDRMKREGVVEPLERTRIGISNERQVKAVMELLKQIGVDFVKIRTVSSIEVFHAIAAQAKLHGLTVVGHSVTSIDEILDAEQKSVEHLFYPPLPQTDRKSVLERMALSDFYITPTLVGQNLYDLSNEDLIQLVEDDEGIHDHRRKYIFGFLLEDWKEQVEERIQSVEAVNRIRQLIPIAVQDMKDAYEAGVPVLAGSDVAVVSIFPGFSLHEELQLLVETFEMTPHQALLSATRIPAEYFKVNDELGTIEVGKKANLVLLNSNPLQDIQNTQDISGVIAGGRCFSRNDLDSLLDDVIKAAKKN